MKKLPDAAPYTIVVEDVALARQSYCEHLSDHGLRVLQANSIASALSVLAECDVGVAVIDMHLPDGNGLTLIDSIRRQPHLPFIQFVLISANITVDVALRAMRLSVSDILTKPFAPSDLLKAVKEAASRAQFLKQKSDSETAALATLKNVKLSADTAVESLIRLIRTNNFDIVDEVQSAAEQKSELSKIENEISRLKAISRVFGGLLSTSSWQMMLIMHEAHLRNSAITIKGIAAATEIPISTALRKLAEMEASFLIERKDDPNDARRTFVHLSNQGLEKMRKYFSAVDNTKGREKCTA